MNCIYSIYIHLAGNTSGKFKVLGIHFNLYKEDKVFLNFSEKIKKVKNSLSPWTYRDLTYIVRITVIKTLALPLLVQIFTILSNPSVQVLTEI